MAASTQAAFRSTAISSFGLPHDPQHTDELVIATHAGEPLTLSEAARRRALYLVGQTGSGKSTLLTNLVAQDLAANRGVIVIDPLGGFADAVLPLIPLKRIDQVCIIDPADPGFAVGFNVLDHGNASLHATIADDVVAAFVHIFGRDAVGDRSQQVLRNAIRALLYEPGTTLLGVNRLLIDDVYRARIVRKIHDPIVANYWLQQFAGYEPRYRNEVISPIQNKLDAVLSSNALRNILGQPKSTFDLRRAMDTGQIIIVPLRKGLIGEINARILGALFVTKIAQTALSRANIPERDRHTVYLYADEFQDFASTGFARILSQARQYAIAATLSHQHLSQLPNDLRDSVIGNVASVVALRVGAEDSPLLAAHIGLPPDIDTRGLGARTTPPEQRLSTLPNYQAFARLLVDDAPTEALHLVLPQPPKPLHQRAHRVIANSRAQFARPRAQVEIEINRYLRAKRP